MNEVFAIETTALCNYHCEYCVQKYMTRPKGNMTWEDFALSIELCKELKQDFVILSNHGEPLLHPDIVKMVEYTTKMIGQSMFHTNGSLLTKKLAINLKNAGLTQLTISTHNKIDSDRAIAICDDIGLFRRINDNNFYSWAKQIKHPFINEVASNTDGCKLFIERKKVVVLWDGRINSCCIEMDGDGVIGTIWDKNVLELIPKKLKICKDCHLI